jgi:PAS domain S-box-containing protein
MPKPGFRAAILSTGILLVLAFGMGYFFQNYKIVIIGLLLILFFFVMYSFKLNRDMRFDKTHMTSLFENATEGIILTNRVGDIVLVNPAAEKMFDYKTEELTGKKIEILVPHQYRKSHVRLREGFHKAPEDRVMGHGRDLHGTKKNGVEFPVEVSLSFYKQNNEPFAIAFIIDITHRKQIEQSMVRQQKELEKVTNDIRKLNTELEAKVEERTTILKEALMKLEQSQIELHEALDKERQLNEIKSRFVSMASHEFRTPLSTVLSSASLLSKYVTTEEQEKRNKHINRIKESVKHLNDILEDFLSLGKLDEGKVITHFGVFDIHELVIETTEEMKDFLKPDQHILFNHEGKMDVYSDKNLLKNILINLITNAIKFSSDGARIKIDTRIADGTAEIAVTDQGIGISKEDQLHLFSSFFRGANAVNIQGTGLGLHIVKRYIDLLNGKAGIQSELNKGTTISVSIPVNQQTQ